MKDDLIKIIERFIQTEMIRFGFPFIAPGPACFAPRLPRMHTIAVPSSSVHDLSLSLSRCSPFPSLEGRKFQQSILWLPVCRLRSPRRIYTLPFFAFFSAVLWPGQPPWVSIDVEPFRFGRFGINYPFRLCGANCTVGIQKSARRLGLAG